MLEDYVLLKKWSLIQEKVMTIKCTDAWLGQIVVTCCEVGIVQFTQTMPAVKLYPVQVFVSNKISILRGLGCVTNEDTISVSVTRFFMQSSQDAFETCHEILVLELIGDCCSRQSVGRGSVHYQFKLPIQRCPEIFIWRGKRRIFTQQNKRRGIPWLCCNLTDWVFYTGMKNDCFLIYVTGFGKNGPIASLVKFNFFLEKEYTKFFFSPEKGIY